MTIVNLKKMAIEVSKNRGNVMFKYYICKFILYKITYSCLWHSDTEDFFKINNKFIYFNNIDDLRKIIIDNNLIVGEEIDEFDCDKIKKFSRNNLLSPNEILNFWNILTDVSKDFEINFVGNKRNRLIDHIYNKLFYGCNLPTINISGKIYVPKWRKKEIEEIKKIIENGILILKKIFWNEEELKILIKLKKCQRRKHRKRKKLCIRQRKNR